MYIYGVNNGTWRQAAYILSDTRKIQDNVTVTP